ncbi:adenylyl cyclase X E-like isoform X1 [Drosophila sulfurigaster albostrigata]|uniref:adenylyl cyclase X E-like isoform X1 n=3 Tax=Drosophila sulfurigaster albostrigata TaxID=89887 RepID=UPI002D21E683|nr:adenylyl cyclase X E-like isoform X1 [Drosophila sulfurigaster albostrigata]
MFDTNWRRCHINWSHERDLQLGNLKKRCEEVGVDKEYAVYERRIRLDALTVFLLLHSAMTIIFCTLLIKTSMHIELIFIDVLLYALASLFIILVLSINYKEANKKWVVYVTSIIAVLTLVSVDMAIHFIHYYAHFWDLNFLYDTYVLFVIYMFLPMPTVKAPVLLGCSISCIYILFFFIEEIFYNNVEITHISNLLNISIDLVDYIWFNLLGTFFRLMTDIIVRSSFLERHQFMTEDIMLKGAREQEKMLLHSILPPQIAQPFQDDIRSRIALSGRRHGMRSRHQQTKERIMAIQTHPDVTILYADVVNYTHLTTTLSVEELVTVLHDLYASFDVAASFYRAQRIKFLGDCYYCVAGLSVPDPDHAKCCINLAHAMIAHIRDVRESRNLDIDMRIGVHSGSILAGVIGSAKLQYDIWGEDVVIANKLESTGVPGHVHISEKTLSLMVDHNFEILPATQQARDDIYLREHNIKTFLIAATDITNTPATSKMSTAFYVLPPKDKSKPINLDVHEELRKEFAEMPAGILSSMFKFLSRKGDGRRPLLGFVFLNFRDPTLEYNFMQEPDHLFKYCILLSWVVYISLFYVQSVDNQTLHSVNYVMHALSFIFQTVVVFIMWYKWLCHWRYHKQMHRYSKYSCFIFYCSHEIQRNLIARLCIYMFIILMYFLIIGLVLMDCDPTEFVVLHIESKLYLYEMSSSVCFQPWVLTKMLCLIIGVTLIFTGIPLTVKIVVGIVEASIYAIVIFFQYDYLFRNSSSTNPTFDPEICHCLLVSITLLSLYFMERQVEFNNKINYNWRVELLNKQQDAHITNKSITILLHNLLPTHVVKLYLTSLEKHEMYFESHKMVAVMFATLKNFEMDMSKLRFLNEIIFEFDAVLSQYKNECLVDKIKIVGCTYMAACGLHIREKRSQTTFSETEISWRDRQASPTANSLRREVSRAKEHMESFALRTQGVTSHPNDEVVFVITLFALDLMRTVWTINKLYKSIPLDKMFAGELSIGISSGEVMAGVVGASQVHYDIWGNPVNMASRMDSTGVPGFIQVTEESAVILRRCGLECDYRGMTYVKGRGILPTYFVGIDDNLEFRSPENM